MVAHGTENSTDNLTENLTENLTVDVAANVTAAAACADVKPGRGRPRRADVDEVVLAAAAAVLGEAGMAGLSMDLVAQRAGVSKATIYRRWPSKEQLVLEVVERFVQPVNDPDTGDVMLDVTRYCEEMAARVLANAASDVLPHLVAAACHDDGLHAELDRYIRLRRLPLRSMLRRGVQRGQLPEGFEVEMTVDMLLGAFMYRRLLLSDPVRPAQARAMVARLLAPTC